MEIVAFTKNIPSPLSFIKTLEHANPRKFTNLNLLKDTLPSRLGIHDELIPNSVLNPGFVPLLLVKNLVVAN